jgi:hypothetical protein
VCGPKARHAHKQRLGVEDLARWRGTKLGHLGSKMRSGCGAAGHWVNRAEKLRGARRTSNGGLRSEHEKKGGERKRFSQVFLKKRFKQLNKQN